MAGEGFWLPLSEITVRKGGSDVGTRPAVNFIEGSNVTLTVADDAGNDEVDVTIAAAGGGGSSDLVQLDEVDLASDQATISFSSIVGTHRDLVIHGRIRTDRANGTDRPEVQMGNSSVDTGTNYDWFVITSGTNALNSDAQGDSKIQTAGVGAAGDTATAGYFSTHTFTLHNYADTSQYRLWRAVNFAVADGATYNHEEALGFWKNTADVVDIITFSPGGGSNFKAGTKLTLYGRG